MTEDELIVAEAHRRVESTSSEAVAVALRHVAVHEPFASAPTDTGDRDLAQFHQLARQRLVDKDEMLKMVERNLARNVSALWSKVVTHPNLDAVRLSVLAHVALVIRTRPLLEADALWAAISHSAWDDAADELLMTKWPDRAKEDGDKRRVLELARMMRTGVEPSSRAL